MDDVKRLYEAAEFGTIEDVRAAFEICSVDERKEYGKQALRYAARNLSPNTLEIVEFLMEREIEPDWQVLFNASGNIGPCAFDIVEWLINDYRIKPDIDIFEKAVGNTGSHALEIVKLLLKQGLFKNMQKHDRLAMYSRILRNIAKNSGPCAFEMLKLLEKRRVEPFGSTLFSAVENTGPCAVDIMKYLLDECGCDPFDNRSRPFRSLFMASLYNRNTIIADYLLSRDDFRLSDLMPCPRSFYAAVYKAYREKAISHISELIDTKRFPYAKFVAADIRKALKTEDPKPTQEDIEALGILANKIASMDWVGDAQVSSSDFDCALDEIER